MLDLQKYQVAEINSLISFYPEMTIMMKRRLIFKICKIKRYKDLFIQIEKESRKNMKNLCIIRYLRVNSFK